MLDGARNQYQGIHITSAHLPADDAAFAAGLVASLSRWRDEGLRVAWLELPAARAALLPQALCAGFELHHCRPDRIVLTLALEAGAYVPTAATHGVGVGGIVLDAHRRLLVVLERRDVTERPGYYKLPGGMLEPGEFFADGVVREVAEETGITSRFRGLVALRHHHRGQFGASNIYAVCLLEPLSDRIEVDDEEIGDARWVDVDQWLADPVIGAFNKRVVRSALAGRLLEAEEVPGFMQPGQYEALFGRL